jgi:nicotinate phosphoribosyltransferase
MNPATSLLLTDLYQLTMLEAYVERGMSEPAVFELFVRRLPRRRNFLMAAGLRRALEFLAGARFTPEELTWLRREGGFRPSFLDYLEGFRFTGDVHALAEGTVFFADEPILRVTAPLPEAQIVETRIMNIVHFETTVASKAARMVIAAAGRALMDFGCRRAHGSEAALLAAEAAYTAGFAGTATVLAKPLAGIPIFGTMAHSFIQAHEDEAVAFERFARVRPENVVLLIDTYDTEAAAHKVVALAPRLAREGIRIAGVRLDSGDLAEHARRVRRIFDDGGLRDTQIFASGGLDEHEIARLVQSGAPIDGFGVGTSLTTSSDAPALDCAYKLEEYAGIARRKRSEGKSTWPGRKQIYRSRDELGVICRDVLTIEGDARGGEPLVELVMRKGARIGPPLDNEAVRAYAASQLASLPASLRRLDPSDAYPVDIAPALRRLAEAVDQRTSGQS